MKGVRCGWWLGVVGLMACRSEGPNSGPSEAESCEGGAPAQVFFADADQDGFGTATSTAVACDRPAGFVAEASDCDDGAAGVHPGQVELCDGVDQDCDGLIDDEAEDATAWYGDLDGDGFGNPNDIVLSCTQPPGRLADALDCDDADDGVNPAVADVCDELDRNCDGRIDACSTVLRGEVSRTSATAAWQGEQEWSRAGEALAPAGDVDGDGFNDLLVAAPLTDVTTDGNEGAAYLIYGRADLAAEAPRSLADEVGWVGALGDELGLGLAGAGDLNGDGLADLVLGAAGADTPDSEAGAAWIFYGPAAGEAPDAVWTGELSEDRAGASLAGPGDVDGDGQDDLLVGAWGVDSGGDLRGAVYLVYGPADAGGSLSAAPRWTGKSDLDYLGQRRSLSGADFDGDGLADLAMGAFGYSVSRDRQGVVYVLSGEADRLTGGVSAESEATSVLVGTEAGTETQFGMAVSAVGDLNADGFADLAVGGPYYETGTGEGGAAWVFFGPLPAGRVTADEAELVFLGANQWDYTGSDLAGAGDIDGDGHDELVVGAPGYDLSVTTTAAGAACVIYGAADLSGTRSAFDGDHDLRVSGGARDDELGAAVAGADLDGDGQSDLLLGAPGTAEYLGGVYLFRGGLE
jgi:hypothetical protein